MRHRPRLSGGESVTGYGRNKRSMGVRPCEQAGGGNVKSMRKAEQHKHGNIVSTQFYLADIPVMHTHLSGERPLGEPSLLSVLTDNYPKKLQGWIWSSSPFSHGVPREEIP